ncbi:MAG: response regulator transcription factor, partial [Bdellovibrionota bacterium]
MFQILVVEDSEDLQDLVKMILRPVAELTVVPSVSQALEIVTQKKFDLVLMDVMLSDGNGFDLTAQIRNLAHGQDLPIIFLTSKGEIGDKITGFKLGAEDYIVKPFDATELRLRVENRLQKIASASNKKMDVIEIGNLRLEVPFQKAYLVKEGQNLELTPLQFKILFFLVTNKGSVISREKLVSEIWGKDV